MIPGPEDKIRQNAEEASQVLIEPFKRVVGVAMRRLANEGITVRTNIKSVALFYQLSGRLYLITDLDMTYPEDDPEEEDNCGLFIEGVQLDVSGEPSIELESIQVPRSVAKVIQENLYGLRGCHPILVSTLAFELQEAEMINLQEYENAVEKLRKR